MPYLYGAIYRILEHANASVPVQLPNLFDTAGHRGIIVDEVALATQKQQLKFIEQHRPYRVLRTV